MTTPGTITTIRVRRPTPHDVDDTKEVPVVPTARTAAAAGQLAGPIAADVAEIIDAIAARAILFLARRIAGDPADEIRETRRLTQADLESGPVRRARCRYWVAQGYVRLLIAHQLYPERFAYPGPFDTPVRLVMVEDTYARHFAPRPATFATRMARR